MTAHTCKSTFIKRHLFSFHSSPWLGPIPLTQQGSPHVLAHLDLGLSHASTRPSAPPICPPRGGETRPTTGPSSSQLHPTPLITAAVSTRPAGTGAGRLQRCQRPWARAGRGGRQSSQAGRGRGGRSRTRRWWPLDQWTRPAGRARAGRGASPRFEVPPLVSGRGNKGPVLRNPFSAETRALGRDVSGGSRRPRDAPGVASRLL